MTPFETPVAASDNARQPTYLPTLNRTWRVAEARAALAHAPTAPIVEPAPAVPAAPPQTEPTLAELLSRERMAVAVAANDNRPKRVRESASAKEDNLYRQWRTGYFPRHLLHVAILIQDALEAATRPSLPGESLLENTGHYSHDPAKPVGQEITVDALRLARKYRSAAGDRRWRILEHALFGDPDMEAIGICLGYPKRRAAKEGRRELIEALARVNERLFGLSDRDIEAAEMAA